MKRSNSSLRGLDENMMDWSPIGSSNKLFSNPLSREREYNVEDPFQSSSKNHPMVTRDDIVKNNNGQLDDRRRNQLDKLIVDYQKDSQNGEGIF